MKFFFRFNFHLWRTKPVYILDILLWPLLKLVWEPFSLKRSHWWHWRMANLPKFSRPLVIRGIADTRERDSWWSSLWQTNFGWKKVVLLGTFEIVSQAKSPRGYCNISSVPFQIGWNQSGNPKFKAGEFEICAIVQQGLVGLLVGPGNVNFFAQTLDGQPLPLAVYGYATKAEALRYDFPIF